MPTIFVIRVLGSSNYPFAQAIAELCLYLYYTFLKQTDCILYCEDDSPNYVSCQVECSMIVVVSLVIEIGVAFDYHSLTGLIIKIEPVAKKLTSYLA